MDKSFIIRLLKLKISFPSAFFFFRSRINEATSALDSRPIERLGGSTSVGHRQTETDSTTAAAASTSGAVQHGRY